MSTHTTRILVAFLACVITAGILMVAGPGLKAQSPQDTFVDLIKPYVNKEIEIVPNAGNRTQPILLKRIGYDYFLIEDPQGLTRAVALNSITSLTLGSERLEIHLTGY